MTTLRFTKDGLIEALEERRAWAERTDKERMKAHVEAERAYLRAFRENVRKACAEAVKWSYAEAKDNGFDPSKVLHRTGRYYRSEFVPDLDRPSCPSSRVASLDNQLNIIRASRQSVFNVGSNGQWSRVFFLLTHDDTIETEMC